MTEPKSSPAQQVVDGALPFSWKILLSGYVPQLAYEHGRLDTSLPFADLRRRSHINEAARAAGDPADFSRRIREGVPRPVISADVARALGCLRPEERDLPADDRSAVLLACGAGVIPMDISAAPYMSSWGGLPDEA